MLNALPTASLSAAAGSRDPLFPNNWFWGPRDGQVYSSAQQAMVSEDDPDYRAWLQTEFNGFPRRPSVWPRNDEPENSDAALQVELDRYGLVLGLAGYAAQKRWEAEESFVFVNVAGETDVPLSVARGNDRAVLHVTYCAIRDGLREDGAAHKFADGKFRSVSNAELETACLIGLAYVQGLFDTEHELQAQIADGTVSKRADVDRAFGHKAMMTKARRAKRRSAKK
jgi:hypothetical protein